MDRGAWRTAAHGVMEESDRTEHTRISGQRFLQGSLLPLSSCVDTCLCGDSTGRASWSVLQETEEGLLEAHTPKGNPQQMSVSKIQSSSWLKKPQHSLFIFI